MFARYQFTRTVIGLIHGIAKNRANTRFAPTGSVPAVHWPDRSGVLYRHSNPFPHVNISLVSAIATGHRFEASYGSVAITSMLSETQVN